MVYLDIGEGDRVDIHNGGRLSDPLLWTSDDQGNPGGETSVSVVTTGHRALVSLIARGSSPGHGFQIIFKEGKLKLLYIVKKKSVVSR